MTGPEAGQQAVFLSLLDQHSLSSGGQSSVIEEDRAASQTVDVIEEQPTT